MATTEFSKKLSNIALGQYKEYRNMDEGDAKLSVQIKKYWTDLSETFESVEVPWSAVFVSWCVKKAGATKTEFRFAVSHSKFVHFAIQNTISGKGVFRARKITEYRPKIGDIVHNNRSGNKFDYAYAQAHNSYESHSAIVIETGEDDEGHYLITVGGNEGDSIRQKEVRLDHNGFIIQRSSNPFISIIENLK